MIQKGVLSSVNKPLISIVIPVKNAEPWLQSQLDYFSKQTLAGQFELIYIDSGSTDQTRNILTANNIFYVTVKPEEFNHGETRNLGVRHAKGEYVVMTVQDAWPVSEDWLENLIAGFVDDEVMAVCGRQHTPHHLDKNPIQWFPETAIKPGFRREQYRDGHYQQLSPEQKRFAANIDNVNTMYRREALINMPFDATVFGEDVIWGRKTIEKGLALVFTHSAGVFHYHHEDYDFAFRRTVAVYYLMYRNFGIVPDERKAGYSLKKVLWFVKQLALKQQVQWQHRFVWLKYNVRKRKAMYDAAIQFKKALDNGDHALEHFYKKYCAISPMAKIKSSSS